MKSGGMVGTAFVVSRAKSAHSKIPCKLLTRFKNEGKTFLSRIIAIDWTWLWNFEPEMKSQNDFRRVHIHLQHKKFVTNSQK